MTSTLNAQGEADGLVAACGQVSGSNFISPVLKNHWFNDSIPKIRALKDVASI